MHYEDLGLVDGFLPPKGEIFRSDVFFISNFTDETHYWRVLRLDDTRNPSTAWQLLALLKRCNVAGWSIDDINEAQSVNDIELLIVDSF